MAKKAKKSTKKLPAFLKQDQPAKGGMPMKKGKMPMKKGACA